MEGSTFDIRLVLQASVSPTEDKAKVLTAATNILGDCNYTKDERDGNIILRSSDFRCLKTIRDQLRDRHVRDAARRLLFKSMEGDKMSLMFNRQAALAGVVVVVSSAEESPLGPVHLHIECDRPGELMDWLSVPRPVESPGGARRTPPSSA